MYVLHIHMHMPSEAANKQNVTYNGEDCLPDDNCADNDRTTVWSVWNCGVSSVPSVAQQSKYDIAKQVTQLLSTFYIS